MEKKKDLLASKSALNKNPLNNMYKTFCFPKSNYKTKNAKININFNPKNTQFHRIWSTKNVISNGKNINLENNDLYYSSSIIFRAPSVKDNRIEISKMMKKEKNKKLNFLKNMHNDLMIKESKLYRKKLYLTGFKSSNNIESQAKIELKKKYSLNSMNDIININDDEKNNNINMNKINLSINFKGSFNKTKLRKNTLNSYENTLIRYEYLKKNLDENNNKNKKNNIKNFELASSTYKTNYRSIYGRNNSEITKSNDINTKHNKSTKNISYKIFKKEPKLYINNENKNLILEYYKPQNSYRLNNDKSIEMSKMSLKLNDIICNSDKTSLNKNILEIEKLLIKFKTFKQFQLIRLEEESKMDIKSLEKKIFLLEKNLKKFNKISIIYFEKIQEYIAFLNDTKININNILEEENNKRFNLYFELEKLVIENVIKQKELEHLIMIKNFLVQVKFYLIKQPSYFNKILKEKSRKYDLGRLILSLNIQSQNQNVIKFIESIPELKLQELNLRNIEMSVAQKNVLYRSNINNKTFIKKKDTKNYSKMATKNYNNNNDNEKNIMKYLNNPDKIVFKMPEDFIEILLGLENKNLRLIHENYYIRKHINRLKRDYDNICEYNISFEIEKDIKVKEDNLKLLKEENHSLNQKYKYLTTNSNRSSNSSSNRKAKKGKENGFILDINALQKMTYDKIIEKYNKKGILLFEKLLTMIKNFFDLNYKEYGIDKGYRMLGKNYLNKILKLNLKNIKNLSTLLINEYTLSLLKIYENICEFVKYKDAIYGSIEENKKIIHKKKEEIQIQRKLKNSRYIRQLAEEKRINGVKKILEKNNSNNIFFKKILDENIVLKNKIIKNKSLAEIDRYKKNFKEKEFHIYVGYNN